MRYLPLLLLLILAACGGPASNDATEATADSTRTEAAPPDPQFSYEHGDTLRWGAYRVLVDTIPAVGMPPAPPPFYSEAPFAHNQASWHTRLQNEYGGSWRGDTLSIYLGTGQPKLYINTQTGHGNQEEQAQLATEAYRLVGYYPTLQRALIQSHRFESTTGANTYSSIWLNVQTGNEQRYGSTPLVVLEAEGLLIGAGVDYFDVEYRTVPLLLHAASWPPRALHRGAELPVLWNQLVAYQGQVYVEEQSNYGPRRYYRLTFEPAP